MRRHRPRRRPDQAPVAVIDAAGRALAPCAPARARALLRRGRAWLLTTDPPRIQLTYRVPPDTEDHR
jgi:2-succinyl-5-enolpyruvyl-6-hydroxy-3-cyclohexene-1-carboxylate synthase